MPCAPQVVTEFIQMITQVFFTLSNVMTIYTVYNKDNLVIDSSN